MEGMPGFGFRPDDVELVGHYLRIKLEGNTNHGQVAINEVKICSYDPWDLRFQSKYKSRDAMWYFFSRIENKYENGNRQSRTTKSGKWKVTGVPTYVTDQWGLCSGGYRGKIGHKRVLVFVDGRYPEIKKSDWVIHEFHCDLLPEHKRTHVICRLEYKGDDADILSANAIAPTPSFAANMTSSEGSVVNQSRQGNSGSYNTYSEYDSANHHQQYNENLNMHQSVQGNLGSFNNLSRYDSVNQGQQFGGNSDMQQSVQGNSGYFNPFPEYDLANHDQWLSDYFNLQQHVPCSAPNDENSEIIRNHLNKEICEMTYMQEHYSDHRPKKPVTGVLADDSSDTETGSMIFEDTSSSTDSVGSSSESYHTIDDISSLTTVEPSHNYEAQDQPKQLKLQCQSQEKVKNTQKSEHEWKMAEDWIRKPPSTNTVKQSWVVLDRSQRNAQWNHLKNMIIGVLLFISIIGWIILVG